MATIYYEKDVQPEVIRGLRVAVLGYGSQGHAHAQNLRDSGVEVVVGLHEESKSRARAAADGLPAVPVAEAVKRSDVIVFCVPDVPMRGIYEKHVAPNLREGQMLLFAHGFNIHYKQIEPPPFVDVAMVAPKGPGHRLRGEFVSGVGIPSLVAVHRDATGKAKERALSYAWGIGSAKAGVLETTFKEETETDLFGEQAVLCGGVSSLVQAGFETLVDAGYQPEAAYFECLHELKLIVDLMYVGGLSYMRYSISDTAEWGDYVSGPRVVGAESRAAMRAILSEIQSGQFAQEWIAENASGRTRLTSFRQSEGSSRLETVGRELRKMMSFIEAKEPGEQ